MIYDKDILDVLRDYRYIRHDPEDALDIAIASADIDHRSVSVLQRGYSVGESDKKARTLKWDDEVEKNVYICPLETTNHIDFIYNKRDEEFIIQTMLSTFYDTQNIPSVPSYSVYEREERKINTMDNNIPEFLDIVDCVLAEFNKKDPEDLLSKKATDFLHGVKSAYED